MSVKESNSGSESLKKVVTEIERGVASLGWDRPPMLYALVPTTTLLTTEGLPVDVRDDVVGSFDGSPSHLSAVLQELEGTDRIEEVLPQIAWPETVDGAALTVERVVVPPEVEAEAPKDPEEAVLFFSNHPAREEMRLIVGVNRRGETWSAIRTRSYDDPSNVMEGENLVPGLSSLLLSTFDPDTNEGG